MKGYYGSQMMPCWWHGTCEKAKGRMDTPPYLEFATDAPPVITPVNMAITLVCPACGERKEILIWLRKRDSHPARPAKNAAELQKHS